MMKAAKFVRYVVGIRMHIIIEKQKESQTSVNEDEWDEAKADYDHDE